jgi:GT2 family glycosyltransferase
MQTPSRSRRWSGDWGTPQEQTTAVVDVLIPTVGRAAELAVTLAGLAAQDGPPFAVIVSDQSIRGSVHDEPSIAAMVRVLRAQGRDVRVVRHLPRRGIAEQRAFLLSMSSAPFALHLDDDVWLEPDLLARLHDAITRLDCGLVGAAPQGLSYLADVRPQEHATFERWEGGVEPEQVDTGSAAFARWPLHNAANLVHIAAGLDVPDGGWLPYRVAWIGACALYRRSALDAVGGFDFWKDLPPVHVGEDVVAQWRVMRRFGGAGLLPSGAVHLEAPTSLPDRSVEARDLVDGL